MPYYNEMLADLNYYDDLTYFDLASFFVYISKLYEGEEVLIPLFEVGLFHSKILRLLNPFEDKVLQVF